MTEQKQKAIEFMNKLDISKIYIRRFREKDRVCVYENYGGFWVDQRPEVYTKMKEIEEKYQCKVYAITHELTEFGELYDFLIVTSHPEEWDTLIETKNGYHTAFAYVWVQNNDDCFSEFGDIGVASFGGGIKRVA